MAYYLVKLLLSAAIIVAVTEVAKTNATLGGLIKSLPLVSLIALIWLHHEGAGNERIADVSLSTFWFVLPTLPMFLLLPGLLRLRFGFYPSLLVSVVAMLLCYWMTAMVLRRFGINL